MNTYTLIQRYRDKLGYPADQTIEMLARFIDGLEIQKEFKRFLREETGVDLDPDDESFIYNGKPFSVFAFREGHDDVHEAAERIDVDSEVLALEAFSRLLSASGYERFVIVQFNPPSSSSRELLRYDRTTSGRQW